MDTTPPGRCDVGSTGQAREVRARLVPRGGAREWWDRRQCPVLAPDWGSPAGPLRSCSQSAARSWVCQGGGLTR